MTLQEELKFRELQVIFFNGMAKRPDDKEQMEKMFKVFFKFIDSVVERECSAIVAQVATVKQGGIVKGMGDKFKN